VEDVDMEAETRRPPGTSSGNGGSGVTEDEAARRIARQNAWEWVIAAAGAAITIAAIGLMVSEGLEHSEGEVPDVVVKADSIVEVSAGYVLVFSAINEGDATAAAVQVTGTLFADTGIVEERSTTMDFVPTRSQRGGGLIFRLDPRAFRVTLRAEGYQKP
jgi:uncharacterized protein (TIGR02588 family)